MGVMIGNGVVQASAADPTSESHVFDPVLSLTGSCAVSELDPKPDPGLCPMPPGVPGVDHPKGPFAFPEAVTTDSYGNIYVSNRKSKTIDIFDASGRFITEFEDQEDPQALAVDSKGNLYVSHPNEKLPKFGVVLYEPTVYEPAEGQIEYAAAPKAVLGTSGEEDSPAYGLAVNAAEGEGRDQLFVKTANSVWLLKSADEGNGVVEHFEIGLGSLVGEWLGVAVDAERERLLVGRNDKSDCVCVRVMDLASPHNLLFEIKGSAVPAGKFVSPRISIAVDEGTGNIFLFDTEVKKVYEFDKFGGYLATVGYGFVEAPNAQIGVDNGKNSPNGAGSDAAGGRYLYVPSNPSGTGHSYAFGPLHEGKPEVKSTSFANVSETEAELRAEIEPFGLSTDYAFEYVTQQQFEETGSFTEARVAGEGTIPAGNSPVSVSVGANGLQPGTAYLFRVIATNSAGSDEGEGEFATYPATEPTQCPNDAFRIGFSALLPDCRAYELVTPPSTNARPPTGVNGNLGAFFASREASPVGAEVSFEIYGGSLPETEATGSLAGDPYLASRSQSGWSTSYVGPNGLEAPAILPGSHSPDQRYSFWTSDDPDGSASIEGKRTNYVRYPDGHSALVGRGSIANDPGAQGRLIAASGSHIIFESKVQLEPGASPNGTGTIYDRTPDEVTHVVSLLPGGGTPKAGEDATYEGASLDGKGIAFKIDSILYLHVENDETFEVGENVTFAGVAEGGSRIFYLKGGDLWRYDVLTGTRTPFTGTGDVVPVNVSADGTGAYFVSQTAIPGTENPEGGIPTSGEENLYRSEEGNVSFVGTVTERDVVGGTENVQSGGLGLWVEAVGPGEILPGAFAIDPSRTTADGGVLLFESRAPLTGYDAEGKVEIYRYDFTGNDLSCLSCNPTKAAASGDASLQSILQRLPGIGGREPLSAFAYTTNLTPDGRRAFFQSTEALVPDDTDGLQDVYEWEAQGVGSCIRPQGCVSLISSGHSARIDYLFAVSDSGNDVFFRTSDLLLPSDLEETASIYDARVEGGVAEEPELPVGVSPLSPPPSLSTPGVLPSKKSGNVKPPKRCRKGKKKVRRHGKAHCVKKKQHHKRHHRKVGKGKKGGRK